MRHSTPLLRRDGVKILVLLDRYLEANPVADTVTEPNVEQEPNIDADGEDLGGN